MSLVPLIFQLNHRICFRGTEQELRVLFYSSAPWFSGFEVAKIKLDMGRTWMKCIYSMKYCNHTNKAIKIWLKVCSTQCIFLTFVSAIIFCQFHEIDGRSVIFLWSVLFGCQHCLVPCQNTVAKRRSGKSISVFKKLLWSFSG